MENLFFPKEKTDPMSREEIEAGILAHRFEGKCGQDAIVTKMKRFGIPLSESEQLVSFCLIKEDYFQTHWQTKLKQSNLSFLPMMKYLLASSPVLITVEPVSSAILRIELVVRRTAENWSNHLQEMKDNGFLPRLSTSDAFVSICAAHEKTLGDIPWQLDTFHGIAHIDRDWNLRLEKAAYSAIEKADVR